MKDIRNQMAVAMLALLLLVPAAGCEDSAVTAPQGATMRLQANPSDIVIDSSAGETEGSTVITATLFDENGFSLQGVSVQFATSAGSLQSAAGGTPVPVETNANGVASDVLTVDISDVNTIEVSASSGSLFESVTVSKDVSLGNRQPQASIDMDPNTEQRKGLAVTFDGTGSDDPDGDVTCYKWTVVSTLPSNTEVVQGPTASGFSRTYALEQTLTTIILRVSDDPDAAASFCNDCEGDAASCGAGNANFSPFFDSVSNYEIVCDLTGPTVNAGGNRVLNLGGNPSGQLTLTATAGDPESGVVSFDWNCGTNDPPPSAGGSAVCDYTNTGTIQTIQAQVVVTNGCGDTTSATITVTINP